MKTTEELYARLLQITARRTLRAGQWLMVFSADKMKQFDDTLLHITSRIYESERLEKENAELRTEFNGALATMMAAAVEIQEHWDAHCDVDGYGPANLMRRLEKGFCNAGYGYSANTVVELTNEIEQLRTKLDRYTRRSESGESLGDALDMAEEIEQLRAENAELRAKLDEVCERAALMCEGERIESGDPECEIYNKPFEQLADAIRALKEKP